MRCLEYKLILKALCIGHGYFALWITINLSNLRYPLILKLAGVSFSSAINQIAFKKIQDHLAIMNPITVAQFFHITCITIIDHLIVSGRQDSLLGLIFYHYGIVETNSHGMLHLYCMLWLSGNLDLMDIRTQLHGNEVYASQIIIYLDRIISCYIDETILQMLIL